MFIETSAKTGYNVKQVSSDSVFRDVELFIEMQAVMSFDWLWMKIELQVMIVVILSHGTWLDEDTEGSYLHYRFLL